MGKPLLGVAGWPVAHSRSPAMHNAALRALGLDWLYVPLPLPVERFAEAVPALPASGFIGVNVTVPHKQAALALADEASATATAIGAANTLTFVDGAIVAENTDAGGLVDALRSSPNGLSALVLGAGGSARAVAWALREAGAAVSVWNRTPERAEELARDLGVAHVARPLATDLLVHCTSVGLDRSSSGPEGVEMLGLAGLDPPATVVDLVYGSEVTPVVAWALAGGARVVEGTEVLVHQGALSLERWTGRPAPIAAMRAAVGSAPGLSGPR